MLIINAIGFSQSGKTTPLEAITRHYSSQGKLVAAIKDIHGEEFQPDEEGKDTWQYSQAGAQLVVGRGPRDTIFHWSRQLSFLELVGKVVADVLIVEGFKDEQMPRIVCSKDSEELADLVDSCTYCISGVISEESTEYEGIPVLNAERDLPQIIA